MLKQISLIAFITLYEYPHLLTNASAHKCLRIGNKEIKFLIKTCYFKQVWEMLNIASCIYCLNKYISIAFNVIFVSFKCPCSQELLFYSYSPAGPALGARYWQLSAIFVHYLEKYL